MFTIPLILLDSAPTIHVDGPVGQTISWFIQAIIACAPAAHTIRQLLLRLPYGGPQVVLVVQFVVLLALVLGKEKRLINAGMSHEQANHQMSLPAVCVFALCVLEVSIWMNV